MNEGTDRRAGSEDPDPLGDEVKPGTEKRCWCCKLPKATTDFGVDQSRYDGIRPICKLCASAKGKGKYQRHKQKILAQQRVYRVKNSEIINTAARARYSELRDLGLCKKCGDVCEDRSFCDNCAPAIRESQRKSVAQRAEKGLCLRCGDPVAPGKRKCRPCLDYVNQMATEKHHQLRLEVLRHYGGRCACCGETASAFLAIDHTNNDGSVQRKEIGASVRFYLWIKKNNFPETLRVLCHNCNFGSYLAGQCPHQIERDHQTSLATAEVFQSSTLLQVSDAKNPLLPLPVEAP